MARRRLGHLPRESTVETVDGRIFISYRRQETAWPARQLYEALCERYGVSQVFKDVDNIAPGEDFVERVSSTVASCEVLVAMLGPRWASITDEDGNRRIDDPDDFVRLEVGTALSRGVLVVPILVDGAKMPKSAELPPDLAGLARRQAVEINPTGFNLERLYLALDQVLKTDPGPDQQPVQDHQPAQDHQPVQPRASVQAPAETVPIAVVPAEAAPGAEPLAPPPASWPPAEAVTTSHPPVAVPDPVLPASADAPRPASSAGSEPALPDPRQRFRLPILIGTGVVVLAVVGVLALNLLNQGGAVQAVPTQEPTGPTQPATSGPDPRASVIAPIAAMFTIDQAGTHLENPVVCTAGRVFSIEASGQTRDGDGLESGPDGAAGWFDLQAPLPQVPLGALIATVGGSPAFVGDTYTLVCPADGELALAINSLTPTPAAGELTGTVSSRDELTEDELVITRAEVPATASWVGSGFECVTDHNFRVSATGIASAEGAGPEAAGGPDGVRLVDGEIVPGAVVREVAHRALLGRIGDGDPFLLGSSATLTCPADGVINLQTNDGVLEDNTGSFSVTLSRWPDPPR